MPITADVGCRNFCIIELQGEVRHDASLKRGFRVGTLGSHPEKADRVCLQIGYHRLEGTRVSLKKPIVLLRRRWRVGDVDSNGATQRGEEGGSAVPAISGEGDLEFYVQGCITAKYIFKDRPKALISQAS